MTKKDGKTRIQLLGKQKFSKFIKRDPDTNEVTFATFEAGTAKDNLWIENTDLVGIPKDGYKVLE